MLSFEWRSVWAGPLVAMLQIPNAFGVDVKPTASCAAAAIENVTTLVQPGRVGCATFWEGGKYVQRQGLSGGELR